MEVTDVCRKERCSIIAVHSVDVCGRAKKRTRSYKTGKKGCRQCGEPGHNKRTCTNAPVEIASICNVCYCPRDLEGFKSCRRCREMAREREMAKRAEAAASGLCNRCLSPRSEGRGGYCNECADARTLKRLEREARR